MFTEKSVIYYRHKWNLLNFIKRHHIVEYIRSENGWRNIHNLWIIPCGSREKTLD